jgi:hypothetical protein
VCERAVTVDATTVPRAALRRRVSTCLPRVSSQPLSTLPSYSHAHGAQVTSTNIEVARVLPGTGYGLLKKDEVEALLAKAASDVAAEGR